MFRVVQGENLGTRERSRSGESVEGNKREDSGSGGESASESASESDSDSDSESSDSSSQLMAKPVYISKTKREQGSAETDLQSITLAKVEFASASDAKLVQSDQFDGVDDTDDVNPAAEFGEWMARERGRLQRHRDELRSEETEKDEALKRRGH